MKDVHDASSHVILDPEEIVRLCNKRGWSKRELQAKADLSPRTVAKIYDGVRVRISSANNVARALGLSDLESLLAKGETRSQGESEQLAEWEPEGLPTAWITAANELQWRVCKLRHRYLSGKYARGKCYELSNLADKEREERRHLFVRHPAVCTSLQRHPQFPLCFGTFPQGNAWWVIDEWIEGRTLAEFLASGGLPEVDVKPVMRQIAEGLQALHERKIIRRELTPRDVVLRELDHSVVLNDFELGKLLDGSPTVSKEWPSDPYRAPEAGAPAVNERADVYCWARIFVHVAANRLPDQGRENEVVANLGLPKSFRAFLQSALSANPKFRPKDMKAVLEAMKDW